MTASNAFGRQVVVALTNKSGGSVAAGDVVYLNDGTNADSFTTGTTSARTGGIGIAQETISNNAAGRILIGGYASLVNVNASVTIGHYGQTYTVAKQATDAGASRGAGTFCQFQTGGTTPDAIIWQPDLGGGSGMTNPMTTSQDIIVGGASGTPGRLAIGAAGGSLGSINGALAYTSGTSNPASAVTGDRYWRTDLGMEVYYDGTRWLSVQVFHLNNTGSFGISATTTMGLFARNGTANDWYLLDYIWTWQMPSGTHSSSAYWTAELHSLDTAGADVTISSQASDKSTTGSAYKNAGPVTINALVGSNITALYHKLVKTSTPGNIAVGGPLLRYRLVAS